MKPQSHAIDRVDVHSIGLLAAAAIFLTVLVGCAPSADASKASPADPTTTEQPVQSSAQRKGACALVSGEQMSKILGGTVTTETVNSGGGNTKCIYMAASGSRPYAELAIDWGMADAGMTAMNIGGQLEPGMTDPYEGLGDRAYAVGPVVMIAHGQDLISLLVMSDGDPNDKLREIFAVVAAQIPKAAS
jgi:hypothetical protein